MWNFMHAFLFCWLPWAANACILMRSRYVIDSSSLFNVIYYEVWNIAISPPDYYKFLNFVPNVINSVLGQLPMRTIIPHQINKAQPLPTRTTIPRTIPHQDNSPLGPLPRNKTTHQDQNLNGGELSSWGVVRIRINSYTFR